MRELIHHKVNVIEAFIAEFNQLQRLFADRSFDFEQQFSVFLQRLSDYFKNRGESANETEVLRIINMLQTVKRGFDPSKTERITSGKRELWWGFAYLATESIESILLEIFGKEVSKLEGGEEILSNLIMNLYQQGFLTDEKLNELDSVQKMEFFWSSLLLSQNGSLALINKKLQMTLIPEDIYLLLEKIVSGIKSQ